MLSAVLRPPVRLRAIPDRAAKWLRIAWYICAALAALTVAVSTLYAVRASYSIQPLIQEHGLDFDLTTEGGLQVYTMPGKSPRAAPGSKLVAIDGKPVPADLVVSDLAKRLDATRGRPASVTLRQPDGQLVAVPVERRPLDVSQAQRTNRDIRIGARMVAALLACSALLLCSLLLALRRPNDPVAMMLAFAFLALAGSIDPPMQYWIWTNQAVVLDVLGVFIFYLLIVGLAAFPDGVFVPRLLRWLLPLGVPLAVLTSMPGVDEDIQGIASLLVLLGVAASLFIRLRRQPAGIARQQIKWAAFGFGVGLTMILGALVLAAAQGDDPSAYSIVASTIILLSFSLGVAVMAAGLLVALIRFRLWEADTVITRSAAYAVVTVIVGVVWAASSDLVKLVITEVLGHESEAGATTVGAIIAAGVFSPTQSAVLGWTRKRFGGPLDRIEGAAQRLKTWGLNETPEEIAVRSLGIIDEAVHPAAAAICLDTPQGRDALAVRGIESAEDRKLIERLPLADEEGSVGELRLGRRSDGNRYNRQELEAVRQLIPHIADALRVARGRHSRESQMQQQLEAMAARLAQLEGGAPRPA
ncbi:hypothetical protein [Sphingomonas arenae]|uniref:hypothetical protein n=1 Tax=Sphingomonas arenae TaxID=2812555 RepID=UPI001967A15E|nr:hypothetical protein [Sphingomonas arenae]